MDHDNPPVALPNGQVVTLTSMQLSFHAAIRICCSMIGNVVQHHLSALIICPDCLVSLFKVYSKEFVMRNARPKGDTLPMTWTSTGPLKLKTGSGRSNKASLENICSQPQSAIETMMQLRRGWKGGSECLSQGCGETEQKSSVGRQDEDRMEEREEGSEYAGCGGEDEDEVEEDEEDESESEGESEAMCVSTAPLFFTCPTTGSTVDITAVKAVFIV